MFRHDIAQMRLLVRWVHNKDLGPHYRPYLYKYRLVQSELLSSVLALAWGQGFVLVASSVLTVSLPVWAELYLLLECSVLLVWVPFE